MVTTGPDFRFHPHPYPERPVRLRVDTPAPGVRLIRAHGVLDRRGSVRLLRLIDSQLTTIRPATGLPLVTASHRGFRELLIDLTDVGFRGNGPANVLAHAAHACARHHVRFGVIGSPPTGSTPAPDGRHRFRTYTCLDAALGTPDRSGDASETARPAES